MAVAPNDHSHHGPLVLAGQGRGESVETNLRREVRRAPDAVDGVRREGECLHVRLRFRGT